MDSPRSDTSSVGEHHALHQVDAADVDVHVTQDDTVSHTRVPLTGAEDGERYTDGGAVKGRGATAPGGLHPSSATGGGGPAGTPSSEDGDGITTSVSTSGRRRDVGLRVRIAPAPDQQERGDDVPPSGDEEHQGAAVPSPADRLAENMEPLLNSPASPASPASPDEDGCNISFKTIHNPPQSFDSNERSCFIPSVPVNVEIISVEDEGSQILNPNLYTIKLTHGDNTWIVKKRYKHIGHLHDQLSLYRVRQKLPMPTKAQRERRRSFAASKNQNLPKFPRKPEALVRPDEMDQRKEQLQNYLQAVLRSQQFKNHNETLKFLDVSHLSFVSGLEPKLCEGMVNKRSGDREVSVGCCGCWTRCAKSATAHWNKRYLVLKDTYIAYLHPDRGTISDVLLMDREFDISCGLMKTGFKDGIIFSNLSRKLQIRTWTQRKCNEWKTQINEVILNGPGKEFIDKIRYQSFAPQRKDARVLWYVDGAGYLSDVADAMEYAKEEIFITDWWLSPEIYMKRPMTEGNKWRLDMIIKRKAEQGVKIFIMLFKEMEMALGINSFYTKAALIKLHPTNIKVLRHPDGINLWSHHEKCVVIDQSIAFVGGIDLCYGRWDTPAHRLTDLGPSYQPPQPGEDRGIPHAITLTSNLLALAHVGGMGTNIGHDPTKYPAAPLISPATVNNFVQAKRPNTIAVEAQTNSVPTTATNKRVPPKLADLSEKGESQLTQSVDVVDIETVNNEHICDDNRTNTTSDTVAAASATVSSNSDDVATTSTVTASVTMTVAAASSGVDVDSSDDKQHTSDKISVHSSDNHSNNHDGNGDNVVGDSDVHDSVAPIATTSATAATAIVHEFNSQDNLVSNEDQPSKTPVHKTISLKLDGVTEESSHEMDGTDNPVFEISPVTTPIEELSRSLHTNDFVRMQRLSSDVNENQIRVEIEGIQNNDRDNVSEESYVLASTTQPRNLQTNGGDITPSSFMTAMEEPAEGRGDKGRHSVMGKRSSTSKAKQNKEREEKLRRARGKLKAMWKFVDETETDLGNSTSQSNGKPSQPESRETTKRAKRPTLRRMMSVKTTEEKGSVVLNPSMLDSPDGQKYIVDQLAMANTKPSTPKARRKIMERAHDMTIDFKHRFRRKQSPSIDGDGLNSSMTETEFSFAGLGPEQLPNPEEDMYNELDVDVTSRLWVGKDYTNFIAKDFVDLDKPFTDFINRRETPRMPWHDIAGAVYGKPARDIARHFIQRWNFTKLEKRKTNSDYPILIPKSYSRFPLPKFVKNKSFTANVQVLRSSGKWSAGISEPEDSIQKAYLDLIKNAKHYVYIENQFFVTISEHDIVKNKIGHALYSRILNAHTNGETFRVYVIMPLLPAFEGEVGTTGGSAIQAVTHWNYASICRGNNSLLVKLMNKKIDPTKYITFYGLRKHEDLVGQMTTELIYVHSKLMIVDDNAVIFGSANINDRSMLGHRDSELAILIEDTRFTESKMNGEPYQAGWFAGTLRKALFREHLGVKLKNPTIDVTDPVVAEFYRDTWIKHASVNTNVYEKVFNCVPTDRAKSYAQLNELRKQTPLIQTDKAAAEEMLKKVQGHLVLLPLMFLHDENLMPQLGTKEALAPTIIWT